MCGICGVIQVSGPRRPVISPEVLARMTDVMTHRGPNDRGVHLSPGVAIGVRRLSIVDVAGGHQPFSNETSTVWAAQNGELYNHGELRTELRGDGHSFASLCDTEILPHLYERYGTAMPQKLRGKFAFVVWDEERGRAVVARDRLGVKPLYYGLAGDRLVFALGAEERSRQRSLQCRPRSPGDRLLSLARLLRGAVDAPRGGVEAAAGMRPDRRERSRSRGAATGSFRSRRSLPLPSPIVSTSTGSSSFSTRQFGCGS